MIFCSDFDEIVIFVFEQSDDWCQLLQLDSISSCLSLHLALIFSFPQWEPTVGVEQREQWECGGLQAWGPGVPSTLLL